MNRIVSRTTSFFEKMRGPLVSVAMAASTFGSSGCSSASSEVIGVSHAPIEVVSLQQLFKLKDDNENLIFNQDQMALVSAAAFQIQDELKQLENHNSSVSQEEVNWKFYDLVNSRSMKIFSQAWDLQKPIPENPLLRRVVQNFKNNFHKYTSNDQLYKDLVIEKMSAMTSSEMQLIVLKFYVDKAFGIKPILAKPKAESKPDSKEIQPGVPSMKRRKKDLQPRDFDRTFPIPLIRETTKIA